MSMEMLDKDGDQLRVYGAADGVTISAHQRATEDGPSYAIVGPIDPRKLIEAIKAECDLHEDDEVHDSPVVEEVAAQINAGHFVVHENGKTIPLGRDEHGRFIPATAEAPRLWAGADEPVIDSLIARVADLEDLAQQDRARRELEDREAARREEERQIEAHSVLADHWSRRLNVARAALAMTPRRGESKPVGIMAAFGGTERVGAVSVTDALKIARFAADEERDIPGVDK